MIFSFDFLSHNLKLSIILPQQHSAIRSECHSSFPSCYYHQTGSHLIAGLTFSNCSDHFCLFFLLLSDDLFYLKKIYCCLARHLDLEYLQSLRLRWSFSVSLQASRRFVLHVRPYGLKKNSVQLKRWLLFLLSTYQFCWQHETIIR